MTDRELLERAAKAAGITPILCYESKRNCLRVGDLDALSPWPRVSQTDWCLEHVEKLDPNNPPDVMRG